LLQPGYGYTRRIESDYTIAAAGTYEVSFGVTNFVDQASDLLKASLIN
jgi:hypothetical protein